MQKDNLVALIEILLEWEKEPKTERKLKPGVVLDCKGNEVTL